MKNKIILIIFILLMVLLIITIFLGIKIGNFQILSISELKTKNEELNEKIMTASTLTSVEYSKTTSSLEETYEKYIIQKQKYEEVIGFTNEDKEQIYETKQYDIAYLWEKVGKYAAKHNLAIVMDVKKASGQNLYDLYFNLSGQYVNISEFIADIENNSDLYFRIYNFKMSGSSEAVTSSFTVKDVNIDPSTVKNSSSIQSDEQSNAQSDVQSDSKNAETNLE